ncbi:Hsp70 family protein [Glycomyces buryatensis]|uniref:Hsp70 family protein n=1 Tax=Glycomyces buryatensis TaxID=2570927 RepID=A0A4S8Q900_9ACTN|nr:Hsp70 family protein [Glycomyces buryatensis]THV40778.1 Hsp70 family protein [Glycomyces buryatensis]
MPAEYLLSVDLGTSHTVAMVVWPDGRTRPLLFDGSPVMPSAVFLDQAGTIHTGRDAERLGPTAPERFEPNPKQRIGNGTILLGDREVDVRDAFAAILGRVASQCSEAAGGLPRTVILTCPAAWGEQRRGTLQDAAARAGYPPVQLITEPVAAAHYYTSRLEHPLNPGEAIAVFDFGGGTLDIAVVEREADGSFAVLADGGLPDLGGLDFDAALVAHIGAQVSQREPDVWKRLETPTTAGEQRDRRTLWNDIRGAKEMLSRSSVAPVTVPGLEQALHLTRGELDQLSAPLLGRAVGETQRVLSLTGRDASGLGGLFLVGGSSRMPLVSKVLHEQLGIAPTALEQPELPVSEGAALSLAAPAPVTPPVMSPQAPPGFSPAGNLPPQTPASDETMQLRMPGAQQPKRKQKRAKWIALAAGIAVLAVAAPLAWNYFADPFRERPFDDLTAVGDLVPYAVDEAPEALMEVRTWEDRTLFAYAADPDEDMHLLAVDNTTGETLWDEEVVIGGGGWGSTIFAAADLLTVRQEVPESTESSYEDYLFHFLDWETGEEIGTATTDGGNSMRYGDHVVSAWDGANEATVFNASGKVAQRIEFGDAEEGVDLHDWGLVRSSEDLEHPSTPVLGNGRMWVLTSDDVVHVYDLQTGKEIASNAVESISDTYFAYDDTMYVTIEDSTGYKIRAYDIESGLRSVGEDYVRAEVTPQFMRSCGVGRVCVQEQDADQYITYRVFDVEEGAIVKDFDEYESGYDRIEPVGENLMVTYYEGREERRTQVYDRDFETIGDVHSEVFSAIDGGTALEYPDWDGYGLNQGPVVGLGGRTGERTLISDALETYGCSGSDTTLACFQEEGMQIFRFRDA